MRARRVTLGGWSTWRSAWKAMARRSRPTSARRPAAPRALSGEAASAPAPHPRRRAGGALLRARAPAARASVSVVVDRGKPVEPRRRDVARLMRSGALDPESNMSFGEGGAGAYTDGKLGTRIHHPAVRKVVELFAHYGGVARILAEGKPHVGTDLLPGAVSAMREDLERGGLRVSLGFAGRRPRARGRTGARR